VRFFGGRIAYQRIFRSTKSARCVHQMSDDFMTLSSQISIDRSGRCVSCEVDVEEMVEMCQIGRLILEAS
jgi:hypothetical protein